MPEDNNNYQPIPPIDIEAEKAVLGAMLKDSDAVMDVIDKLRADDFHEKSHQEIYKVLLELFRKSIAIDLVTVYTALKEKKLSDLVGGMTYLSNLASDAYVSSNATYYADTVIAKARLRSLAEEAERIRSKAYEGGENAEEVLDFAEQRIFEIAQRSQKKAYQDISDVLVQNILQLRNLAQSGGQLPGITTGFTAVDKVLGGLHKTDLIILAARPGMGKTSFALNIAQHAAEAGNSVMIFSMEMSAEQLGARMLSMASNVEMEKLKTGNLELDEWDAVGDSQERFEEMKITIDDTSEMPIIELKNKCRRLKAEKGLDLVIIDYLQLMSLGYNVSNRVGEISAITRAIKILAKELDVAVILLSQLSRKSEERADHKPMLSDLRDSGSIEQDADVVIFLRREDYYEDKDDAPADVNPNIGTTCEVHIAKHRSGPTGTCKLAWVGKYTKFGNLAYDSYEAY